MNATTQQAHISRRARQPLKRMPTEAELLAIPIAQSGEFQLTEPEIAKLRRRLYGLNKSNAAGWRFRTMMERSTYSAWHLLMVWRID